MTPLSFTPRQALSAYEWQAEGRNWDRPPLDATVMARLLERSTLYGVGRVGCFLLLLAISGGGAIVVARHSLWLALPLLYLYYFFYGFWVALGHELQHKTVFARRFNGCSDALFHLVQASMWNSPTYARKSHQLHHRYTMVRGVDPETAWPGVFTTAWLRGVLRQAVGRLLVVGALPALYRDVRLQVERAFGRQDRVMREHCNAQEQAAIRRESAGILLLHLLVVALAVVTGRWELLVMVTLAWQIGSAFESFWHNTEHISRLYNVNDQRLCTRSVKVGPLVGLIYWGLDDHIEHHLFPAVPSRHLPELHRLLREDLPEPLGVVACWREMFRIAREKDVRPMNEYVPVEGLLDDDVQTLGEKG